MVNPEDVASKFNVASIVFPLNDGAGAKATSDMEYLPCVVLKLFSMPWPASNTFSSHESGKCVSASVHFRMVLFQ